MNFNKSFDCPLGKKKTLFNYYKSANEQKPRKHSKEPASKNGRKSNVLSDRSSPIIPLSLLRKAFRGTSDYQSFIASNLDPMTMTQGDKSFTLLSNKKRTSRTNAKRTSSSVSHYQTRAHSNMSRT